MPRPGFINLPKEDVVERKKDGGREGRGSLYITHWLADRLDRAM